MISLPLRKVDAVTTTTNTNKNKSGSPQEEGEEEGEEEKQNKMNSCNYKTIQALWAGFVGGPGGPNWQREFRNQTASSMLETWFWGAVAAASRAGPFLESSVDLVWRAFFQPLIPGPT